MIFEDTVSGTLWQPEPAERYNAVNALLRESPLLPPHPLQGKRGWAIGKVTFCNVSQTLIGAGKAVTLSPGSGSFDQLHCLSGVPAASGSGVWGVAQDQVPAGGCGEAVISGVTEAIIASGGDLALTAVEPQNGELIRSASGRAEILSCASGGTRALLLLGSGGAATEYCGFFKLMRTASGIAVVNGAAPANAVCGSTDLPGCTSVARCELAGNSGTVTLYVHYNESTQLYRASFTESSGAVLSQVIGSYTETSVSQVWRGDTITFSRFYFV